MASHKTLPTQLHHLTLLNQNPSLILSKIHPTHPNHPTPIAYMENKEKQIEMNNLSTTPLFLKTNLMYIYKCPLIPYSSMKIPTNMHLTYKIYNKLKI